MMRVALVCDLLEERWPSMDLIAEQLHRHLERDASGIAVAVLRPPMRRRFTRPPFRWILPNAGTVDRLLNRHLDYPRWLARHAGRHNVYHVVDHSYAHLARRLPAGRTVVTCHDLDAFRCLLDPAAEPRSVPFRRLARRTLAGLRSAAQVVCVSAAVRNDLVSRGIVPAERSALVPNGVDAVFSPMADAVADRRAGDLLGPPDAAAPIVLHVGSTIPRKRIDLVLSAFAEVRRARPRARLVRVGGPFTAEQRRTAAALRLEDAVLELPPLDTATLAAIYRRASVLILPSDREGFGLPVLEALASGTPAVVSDIPALRESGGAAAWFCPPGDAAAFARAIGAALDRPDPGRRAAGLRHAAGLTWAAHAAAMVEIYRRVAGAPPRTGFGSERSA